MDFGPDGSLCRLTSSFDNAVCNVKIVKVSEENQKYPDYKLVLINEKESDSDSASEKSSEEFFSLERLNIELGPLKSEIKDVEVKDKHKTKEVTSEKSQNKNVRNKPFHNHFRRKNLNKHRNNYSSSNQRNFKPYNNRNKSYKRQLFTSDKNDISPWIEIPQFLNTMENYSYVNYPQYAPVGVDSSVNTPVSCNINHTNKKSRGILGNFPNDPSFPTGNVDNFPHNPNYWNGPYSNNYQHPIQNEQISGEPIYKKHYRNWKNRPKFNRNQNNNQKRRGRGGHVYGGHGRP